MMNLVIVVMSIALMSFMAMASINYISSDARIAAAIEPQLKNGFSSLEVGFNNYQLNTGVQPNLMSDITPSYAFIPAVPVATTAWTFGSGGTGGNGRYFCLSGQMPSAMIRAAKNLTNVFSPQAYFINSSCGALSTSVPTGINPSVAITYWVSAYQ